jgi:ArsR family transcriptional regulator, arsenate/arsenite/antimonite-responsive transcriptional repressor
VNLHVVSILVDTTTLRHVSTAVNMYGTINLVTATRARLPLTDLAGCCSPGTATTLDHAAAVQLAGVLKALAEPGRLRLVSMIAANSPQPVCVCELIEPVGLSQPTVSHHLKVLVDAGILTREQRGKWAYFSVVTDALSAIAGALQPR